MKEQEKNISIKVNGEEKNYSMKTNEEKNNTSSQEFSWVVPSITSEKKDKVINMESYKKVRIKNKIPSIFIAKEKSKRDTIYSNIVMAICAAICIGILFGFGLLNFMERSQVSSKNQQTVVPANVTSSKTVQFPKNNYYVLQYGVFKEEEGAKASIEGKKPFSTGILKTDDGYRVFLGVFHKEGVRDKYGKLAQKRDYHYFSKIVSYDEKKLYVGTEEQKRTVEKFIDLFEKMVAAVSEKNGQISKENWESIKLANSELQKLASAVATEPLLTEALQIMNNAVREITNIKDDTSFEGQVMLQKQLLSIFSAYNELYQYETFKKTETENKS